jgi:hypothetical protein
LYGIEVVVILFSNLRLSVTHPAYWYGEALSRATKKMLAEIDGCSDVSDPSCETNNAKAGQLIVS